MCFYNLCILVSEISSNNTVTIVWLVPAHQKINIRETLSINLNCCRLLTTITFQYVTLNKSAIAACRNSLYLGLLKCLFVQSCGRLVIKPLLLYFTPRSDKYQPLGEWSRDNLNYDAFRETILLN